MIDTLPFIEIGQLRTFDEAVDPSELKWHWDEQDRLVTPTHVTDWMFQYDNKLPQPMLNNVPFFVQAGVFHRLIKGTGDLTLKVLKCQTRTKT